MKQVLSLCWAVMAFGIPSASAATVFDNGGPAQQLISGSIVSNDSISADDFMFAHDTSINSVRFWISEYPGAEWSGVVMCMQPVRNGSRISEEPKAMSATATRALIPTWV